MKMDDDSAVNIMIMTGVILVMLFLFLWGLKAIGVIG